MSREIKYKYVVIRENGFVFSKVFDIRAIELGEANRFLEVNHVANLDKTLKRCLYTNEKDIKGIELYEGDLIKFINTKNRFSGDSIMGVKWVDGFVVYNPECCEICNKSYGYISKLDEAIAIAESEFEIVGNIFEK